MPDVARNAPCPCGSKRRYKDCHGAIDGARLPPAPATAQVAPLAQRVPSAYRAPGAEWAGLSEDEQGQCGALMARALEHQLAERFDEATEAYTEVLGRAPHTHDALHMLGAIKMRRGELKEAKRLIVAAMSLRPSYSAIEHNLQMIQDAERAEERMSVQRSPSIELCERALPILVDLALRPRGPKAQEQRAIASVSAGTEGPVHLIRAARGTDADPGWLVRRLATILSAAEPYVWAADSLRDTGIFGKGSRRIDRELALFPRGGCHIFVGIDVDSTEWIKYGEADRTVVICQPAPPADLLDQLRAIACDGARPIHLVFPSCAMAARFGPGHMVLPPPIELRRNPPDPNRDKDGARARLAGLRVGAVGRNWRGESPAEDAQILKHVAAAAGTLELYDAGLLRFSLGGEASVRFHRRKDDGLDAFLEALDCLLICPEPWWLEGDGREHFTAMASGVPVLCPAASIYAEYINDGVDGLIYHSREEAVQQLVDLRRSPARVVGLGSAARAKVAELVDSAAIMGIMRQLVSGNALVPDPGSAELPRVRAVSS
jgi:tetratricopeptide (TPR) repeat protein